MRTMKVNMRIAIQLYDLAMGTPKTYKVTSTDAFNCTYGRVVSRYDRTAVFCPQPNLQANKIPRTFVAPASSKTGPLSLKAIHNVRRKFVGVFHLAHSSHDMNMRRSATRSLSNPSARLKMSNAPTNN